VGAEIVYKMQGTTSFLFGGSFAPSETSTFKGRIDSEKKVLGFAYSEKWSGPLTVDFSVDWKPTAAENPFLFGLKLSFK